MTDTPGMHVVQTPQPDDIDQMEAQVRAKIAMLDKQIAEAREQKKAIGARITELEALRDKAKRMVPRAPRQRRPRQPTLPEQS